MPWSTEKKVSFFQVPKGCSNVSRINKARETIFTCFTMDTIGLTPIEAAAGLGRSL